jgi:hypothetical protein
MTDLLQKAFEEASKLSPEEQDAFAKIFLAELESERRWDELFAKSQDMLEAMAKKAVRDFEQGKTKPIED